MVLNSEKYHTRKMESPTLTKSQKGLFYTLYAFIILMLLFSVLAVKNHGQEGYNKCVQDKCERKGQEFCSKPREIMNCCLGAGGNLANVDNKLDCTFA